MFSKDHRPTPSRQPTQDQETSKNMQQGVQQSFQKLKKEIFRKKLGLNLISLEVLLKGDEHNSY